MACKTRGIRICRVLSAMTPSFQLPTAVCLDLLDDLPMALRIVAVHGIVVSPSWLTVMGRRDPLDRSLVVTDITAPDAPRHRGDPVVLPTDHDGVALDRAILRHEL
jgi:hypothetical protein